MKLSSRLTFLIGFIGICLLLGLATYLQKVDGITPCALCIFQRFVLAALAVFFFIGAVFHLRKIALLLISSIATVISATGIILAGRQVWLQHLPSIQNGDCSASLEYMLQAMPLKEVITKVFIGGTECSRVDWQFLHLSLAEWSLLCFMGLFLLSLSQIIVALRKRS